MIQVFSSIQEADADGARKADQQLNQLLAKVPTARYIAHTVKLVCNTELNVWQYSATVVVDVPTPSTPHEQMAGLVAVADELAATWTK